MNKDYFSIRATAPWNLPSQEETVGLHRPKDREIYQEEINFCLNCTMPSSHCKICTGPKLSARVEKARKPNRKKKHKLPPYPSKDPCIGCYSRSICASGSRICSAKIRWEEKEPETETMKTSLEWLQQPAEEDRL